MKRGIVYIIGVTGLIFLVALTVPRAGRAIQSRLQTEMDFALAEQGLDDIKAQVDGQTVTLDCTQTTDNSPPCMARQMALAISTAETLPGISTPDGTAWRPVKSIKMALPEADARKSAP